MESRFPAVLLDQGLPRDTAAELRDIGIECTHVAEIGKHTASDTEILELAIQCSAVVITLDADFHAILAVKKAVAPSVIRIRMQGLNGPTLTTLLKELLARHARELAAGCLLTVKPRKTTCRLLSAL